MNYRLALSLLTLTLTSCSVVSEVLDKIAPAIDAFEPTAASEVAPNDILFTWRITDPDSSNLTCTLNFADGESKFVENCSQITNIFHRYEEAGNYVTQLSVTDGSNVRSVSAPVIISSDAPQDPGADNAAAIIEQFYVQTEASAEAQMSIFRWELSDPSMNATCHLDFGNGVFETIENCGEANEILYEFTDLGSYRAILTVDTSLAVARKIVTVVIGDM